MSTPNFLFLMADHFTARAANTGACHTPNIDKIAERGIRFRRCYTVNAICSPARATLFTGVHVHAHGMYDCTHTVDDARARFRTELPTWSQALAEAGYHCAYFGKWHVERSNELSRFGWRYQFDEPYGKWRKAMGLSGAQQLVSARRLGGRGYAERVLYGVTAEPAQASRTAHIFRRGAEYLERELANREPWCLFLSTPEPHDPYIAPQEYFDMYDSAKIELPASFNDDLAGKPNVLKRMQRVFAELTADEFREAIACFYAVCSMIDAEIGYVLDALDRIGQAERTVIIFLVDHGDLMGAHRMFTKGVTPYEEVYNVPLVISSPGFAQGQECEHVVSLGDVCPTVLELAQLRPFDVCHFRSLAPLLREPQTPDWVDEAYAEFHGQRYFFTQRILWRGNLKYVMNAFDYDEMYDLGKDPWELENVAENPEYADAREEMLRGIWRKIHETGDETLANAHYWSLRFFDLGPDSVKE